MNPCNVPNCNEAIPADMDDQPTCETCRQRVCLTHAVNRDNYSLCPLCYRQERDAAMSISNEMRYFHTMITWSFPESGRMLGKVPMNAADIEAKLEAWLKTIREVL